MLLSGYKMKTIREIESRKLICGSPLIDGIEKTKAISSRRTKPKNDSRH